MTMKILVADDDPTIRLLAEKTLTRAGYSVVLCESGQEIAERVKSSAPDLALIDVMLGDADGVEITRIMRADPKTRSIPVVLISGKRTDEEDLVFGLEGGADDYLVKPLNPKFLAAKVAAVLRRFSMPAELSEVLKYYSLTVDVSERFVKVRGKDVKLTRKEFDLLSVFLRRRGKLLSPQYLLETVWGYEPETYNDPHTVQVHISRLKKKLGKTFAGRLENVIGSGYRLN
ncbi:MAG: DNA-binding response regulator [Elusimicrobia bacterium]|nr:MAG: DNA-binding response regulator [Elusimicrobiota bacterium]